MTPEYEPMRLPTDPAGSQETAARLGDDSVQGRWAPEPTDSHPNTGGRYAQPAAQGYTPPTADDYAQSLPDGLYAQLPASGPYAPPANDPSAQANPDGYPQAPNDPYPRRRGASIPGTGTGEFPQASTGGFPRAETGGFPRAETGGFPRAETGGIPRTRTGGFPQVEHDRFPRTGTDGLPRVEHDRHPRAARDDSSAQASADRYGQRSSQLGRHHRPPDLTAQRGAREERRNRGGAGYGTVGRWVLLPLFWLGLVGSAATIFLNTPITSLTNAGTVLTALGRASGMAGGYLLLVQILMKSRVAWLEMSLNSRRLLRWHRRLGPFLLIVLIAHMVIITVGLAQTDGKSVTEQTVILLTTWEDMVSAFVAIGVLSAVALLGLRAIRRWLPYELWHLLHSAGYLVLLLAYGHQFANGIELQNGGPVWWYWSGLYAFVVASLIWGRVVEPVWLNLRYRLHVTAVVPESRDSFSVYVGGRRLDGLDGKPGQFYRWRFLAPKSWWQSHPFSLSAAPNRQGMRLTVKAVGDYTRGLRDLRPGTKVIAEGPYGDFTADRRVGAGALLIAGGSGIAPIRALIEEMPPGTVVVYRASTPDELVLRQELEQLTQQRGMRMQYVVGSRRDPGPRRLSSPAGIQELVPDVARRDVYLCGPEGLISTMVEALRRLDVPSEQIHLDPFEF